VNEANRTALQIARMFAISLCYKHLHINAMRVWEKMVVIITAVPSAQASLEYSSSLTVSK